MPLVKALVPFVGGVVLSTHLYLHWAIVTAIVLLMGFAALRSGRLLAQLVLLIAIGWLVGMGRSLPQRPPVEEQTLYLVDVERSSAPRSNGLSAEGRLVAWCSPETGAWHAATGFVQLRSDSLLTLHGGERLLFSGRIYPYRYGSASFLRLMYNRGYLGSCYLQEQRLIERDSTPHRTLHHKASTALKGRFTEESDAASVVRAMTIGDRTGIDTELRTAYARSGMSHLLAVSGLHMGIVFLLINLVLIWLPLMRRGEVVRNLAAILLLWLYLFAVGAPPSAVRAAIMCSILQLSLFSASSYRAMNAWAAAAITMLIWNPAWLYDIGFQLSFVAVAAILLWGVPLCKRCRTRSRLLNAPLHALIIGTTASLATAPLASHAFGLIPLVGLLLNPVVVALASILVGCGLLLLLLPLLAPLLAPLSLATATLLNTLATRIATAEHAALDVQLSAGEVGGIYLLFLVVTLLVWSIERKKSVHL